jgi:succinate-semialdehyde dehydrogenase / glutarate-semialdehyde dehydrogenase
MAIASVNPYTNRTIRSFSPDSEDKINQVLELAGDTFDFWQTTTFGHRCRLMRQLAKVLSGNRDTYARLMTQEMGKPIREAMAEVDKCALVCTFYAEHADAFLRDEDVRMDSGKGTILYQPLGAILAIMPWNFPFWQVFRFAAPAIMAGNVGVLKHASNVPQCALAIEAVFLEAGFPEGVFQTLLVETGKVEKLIADPGIKAITLTGSEKAGAAVAAIAGAHIKKTVMELGGSDPFIIMPDADLEFTAKMAVQARMLNTGQSCICAKRFIVPEIILEEFTGRMKKHMLALKMGDPMDPETDFGPMAREDLANTLLTQVEQSVENGATLVLGGNRPEREGAFFNPTILTDVRPGMPAYNEELFGPVAALITVRDEDEAIEVANDSRYGLGASIWTKDERNAEQLARRIESGVVFINEIVKSDPRLPFGGVKKSGYGRELSCAGIREFTNIKTVRVSTMGKGGK